MPNQVLNYKTPDNSTVGTMTDYQNSGNSYVSQLREAQVALKQQQLAGLDMYNQMAQEGIRQSNAGLAVARENELYDVKNKAAAQGALQSYTDPYMQNIQNKYAKYMQENAEDVASAYAAEAKTFNEEVQTAIDALSDEEKEYSRMQMNLLTKIFKFDPNDVRWIDNLKAEGYIDENGNTTDLFDEYVLENLYGEGWNNLYDTLLEGSKDDQELAKWLMNFEGKSMRNTVAGSLGIEYDPTASKFGMFDAKSGEYLSGTILNESGRYTDYSKFDEQHGGIANAGVSNMPGLAASFANKNNLYDKSTYTYYGLKENSPENTDSRGRVQMPTYGSVIKYADGTTVKLKQDLINAGGNIEGRINSNYWKYIDRTPGTTYGDSLSLEESLKDGKLKVGSIFEGENGKQYMVVYFDLDKTGHSDVAVREVESINTK